MRSLLCTLILACGSAAGQSAPTVQHALAEIGYQIATEDCGAKAQRTKQQVRNRFDETAFDERETIRCQGLVLVKYHVTSRKPPHEILESLSLREAHPKLPKSISPGATRQEVMAYAGTPMEERESTLVYLLNDEGPDQQTATFRFLNGKLASVAWFWSSQ